MTQTRHPSFFELDQLHLGHEAPRVRAHAETCPECRAHLGALEVPIAVPSWVPAAAAPRTPFSFRRLWLLAPMAAALGVGALMVRPTAPPAELESAGVKGGAPAVGLYVKRGSTVLLWDGHATFAPGDSVRLQIARAGFTHVRVEGSTGVLYDAELSAAPSELLPVSWTLDAAPGPEQLWVALTDAGGRAWRTSLRLEKTSAAEPHP